jgi:hypothetical protein
MIPISDEHFEIESCVYKLYYGNRYIIVKGKTLTGSIYLIEKGYAVFLAAGGGQGKKSGGKGQEEWDGVNSYYLKFYLYIYKKPKLPFRIEILLESNNGYDLLMREHNELNACMKDKKCLNSNVESYMPKFREKTQSYGWISKLHGDLFKDFLNKL